MKQKGTPTRTPELPLTLRVAELERRVAALEAALRRLRPPPVIGVLPNLSPLEHPQMLSPRSGINVEAVPPAEPLVPHGKPNRRR